MPGPQPLPRTPPGMVTGYRDPSGTVTGRVIADVSPKILMWEPNATPLCTFAGAVRGKRKATQYRYESFEKEPYPREATVSADATSGATSIVLSAGQGARFAKWYLLQNRRTRELVLVSSVSTDTLTVTRGAGGLSAAMVAGDTLEYLNSAYEDGSGLGTLKSTQETNVYNYTQIIRTPYGFTGRQEATEMYGGRDPMTERRSQAIEHKKHIEYMMFFGQRAALTGTNNFVQSMSGGLEYFIKTNVWDLGSAEPTERAMVEFLEFAMKYGDGGNQGGSEKKYLFCSRRWLTVINGWVKDRLEYRPIDKRIGFNAGFFDTPHGTIGLLPVNIFNGENAALAFLVDMNHVRYVYLQGRDTQLLDNRQAPDIDGSVEEYRSDVGVEVTLEASHGLIRGLPL